MEALDEHDYRILARIGYAVARGQLFEHAMLKLVEVQRHDTTVPLDERWPEVEKWLTKWTAGTIARELSVPDEMAADVKEAVARRNVVAHQSYTFYFVAREKRGDRAVEEYRNWLDEQARVLGRAYNGLIRVLNALKGSPTPLPTSAVFEIWREDVPAAFDPFTIPGPQGPRRRRSWCFSS
jgi:hypothetical protein